MIQNRQDSKKAYVFFDQMVWPHPDDEIGTEHELRYGDISKGNFCGAHLVAASYVSAYIKLIKMPQKLRNKRISQIRAAAKKARIE